MSGHSKWKTIKRQKGTADQKRGFTFTKMANLITNAVREGGGIGDPEQNFRLRLAVEKAKAANVPKENIERAIKKALGKEVADVEETVYEGFGPYGILVIVEAATDNKMRTTSEVKNIFEKAGVSFGQPGSVSYQFESIGLIVISDFGSKSGEDIFLTAIDIGAEDVEQGIEEILVYTKPGLLAQVRNGLLAKGIEAQEASLVRKPTIQTEITDAESAEKITAFIDNLESLDDVQKVYTNVVIKE